LTNNVNGLLGISAKAGKIVSGSDAVLEKIMSGKVYLTIVAEDASEKTIKNFKFYSEKYNVDFELYGTIENNSKTIGKKNRAIIGITEKNLAENIKKVIHGGGEFG